MQHVSTKSRSPHYRIRHGCGYRRGPEPFLGNDLEDCIAAWIIKMARIRYGQMKEQIKDKVQELVKSLPIETPWPDDRPSEKWYKLFMKTHPVLRYEMSQALAREHCGISYTDLAQWFDELRDFILDENHPQILDDVTRIYNCNEIGFLLSPKPSKVITHKSDKHIYQAGTSSKKTQIMTLISCSLSGHYVPPLVVYPGVQPQVGLREKFHIPICSKSILKMGSTKHWLIITFNVLSCCLSMELDVIYPLRHPSTVTRMVYTSTRYIQMQCTCSSLLIYR